MAMEPNSRCAICGKPYYCCNDSMFAKTITPWKKIVDTPEHYKVFITLQAYTNGQLSKEQAAKDLKNCDLSDKHTYKEDIQKAIDTILSTGNANKVGSPAKAKKTVETKINE